MIGVLSDESTTLLLTRQISEPGTNQIMNSPKPSMSTAFGSCDAYSKSIMVTYDIAMEEVPQGLFHNPTYQAELQKDREIARAVTSALERAGLHSVNGDYLQRLISDGKTLSTFEVSSTRTIAILGGSGEGKHASH